VRDLPSGTHPSQAQASEERFRFSLGRDIIWSHGIRQTEEHSLVPVRVSVQEPEMVQVGAMEFGRLRSIL
jgi:hypothetical protein